MNLNFGVDLMPAYTETMRFLNSPPGQVVASKIEEVVADLVKLFHSHSGAGDTSNAPGAGSPAPTPAGPSAA